ncbi:hypothetical protein B0H16DRAFT_1720359 [Mycena metata]|uniref:Uncharacterized protein n=1 Tax=Mycena metata TaxID=1033252 RepID=A0AAD7NG64_9AGAR|nr:hypothetical protein B0H16DRAFT_1720359 [Mycena metata]
MPASILQLLCCCCIHPEVSPENDPTVIPTETTYLIPNSAGLSSPRLPGAMIVDHQKLNDRMGIIVRAKEGKMVNVSARLPFTLQSATASSPPSSTGLSSSPTTPTSTAANAPAPQISAGSLTASRRPPVLTMTPARSRLHAESRYSSPSGSRSSSRRRPELSDRYTYPYTASGPTSAVEGGTARGKQASLGSEWIGETESESSETSPQLEYQAKTLRGVAITGPDKMEENADANTMSIAFSWSDT